MTPADALYGPQPIWAFCGNCGELLNYNNAVHFSQPRPGCARCRATAEVWMKDLPFAHFPRSNKTSGKNDQNAWMKNAWVSYLSRCLSFLSIK